MATLKKTVKNIDRFRNLSTSPSALKLQLKDKRTGQVANAILRNDDFYNYLVEEKTIKNDKDYIHYMVSNDEKPLVVNFDNLKKNLGRRWCSGSESSGENYFSGHVIFIIPITYDQLDVNNEEELLKKYFNYDYKKGSGMLKKEYFDKYTRDPTFIAMLIDLGYDVVWGCYAPVLSIYTTPFADINRSQ